MKPTAKPCRAQLTKACWITVDLFIFLLAAATLVYIEFFAGNVKRGFWCGDKSISLKRNPKDTISIKSVVVFGLFPIVFMWICEFLFMENDETESNGFNRRLRKSFRRMLFWFKYYGINLTFMLLVMDVSKVLIGEHRPHFLQTCRPDTAINCTVGEYIPNFVCTNTEPSAYQLRDVSRSFPSGHASISMYAALFLIWYMQCRIPKIQSQFIVPLIQMILTLIVSVCSISRVTDNRHTWLDVIGGLILGAVFAIYTCHVLVKNFSHYKLKPVISNVNGSSANDSRRSVRRLLSTISSKEEFTLNSLE